MLEIDVDFDDDEPAFKLRGRQEEWLNTIDADLPVHKRVLVVAPGGIGKCLGPHVGVRLFSGEIRAAKDIVAGDILVGDDGLKRNVLSTNSGHGPMFLIHGGNIQWSCNGAHVITLISRSEKRILDVKLAEYLAWDNAKKDDHYMFRVRPGSPIKEAFSFRVTPLGNGPYSGFQIDGNSRFLLADFTVTHNSTIFAALASRYHKRGLKTLVLTNRDMLARQTAGRIQKETGIDVEIEMGGDTASPFAPVVVGSVQTLMRMNRLTSFADDHFGLVVGDEAHFSLATGWQRVLNYFHYGKSSLQDGWSAPPNGTYECKAVVAGFTATPDIGEKKNLGEFYAHRSVNYSYLEAVNDGWLVPPIQKTIPVKVDLRKYKVQRGLGGTDFKASDLTEAMIPIIESLAEQIVIEAHDRKTMAFLPSVECAKMMNDALCRRGINSTYVSGECSDGDEKTEMFRRSGAGSALCNAQIYNFGVDFPDVNCVAWMRATLSKAFLIQGLYRGSRVMPGVIDGLNTPEERRAAIANSAKPNMLILDPLFVSDRIDIMDAYSLFTDKPEVRERMKNGDGLSAESAQKAERDFLKSLEREAKRTANRKARTFDPLAFAVSIGEESLSTWQPSSTADLRPPTKGQIEFLKRQHADTTHIKYFYQAQKLIGRLVMRMEAGLATPNQLSFLAQLGFNEQDASKLTIAQAGAVIDQIKRKKSA